MVSGPQSPLEPALRRDRWHRPYSVGSWTTFWSLWAVVVSLPMWAIGVMLVADSSSPDQVVLSVAFFGFAFALAATNVRLLLFGVWVSASGVRLRRWFSTSTWRWEQISGFEAIAAASRDFVVVGVRFSDGKLVRMGGFMPPDQWATWTGDYPAEIVRRLERERARLAAAAG